MSVILDNADYTDQKLFAAGTNFAPDAKQRKTMDLLQKSFFLRDAMYAVPCLEARWLRSYYAVATRDYHGEWALQDRDVYSVNFEQTIVECFKFFGIPQLRWPFVDFSFYPVFSHYRRLRELEYRHSSAEIDDLEGVVTWLKQS